MHSSLPSRPSYERGLGTRVPVSCCWDLYITNKASRTRSLQLVRILDAADIPSPTTAMDGESYCGALSEHLIYRPEEDEFRRCSSLSKETMKTNPT